MSKLGTILAIVVSLIAILGFIFGLFIKPLGRLKQEQDLDRADTQVFQQEQAVRQYENLATFKRKDEPPSPAETDIIEAEKERLEKMKEKREELVKRYKK